MVKQHASVCQAQNRHWREFEAAGPRATRVTPKSFVSSSHCAINIGVAFTAYHT